MKTRYLLLYLTLFFTFAFSAEAMTYSGERYKREVKPTKNVILMIPDGTSAGTLAATRWYKMQQTGEQYRLALDDYLCGVVRSFSSNAPISDSAPSGSAYSTGMLSQAGNIGIYPSATENDLIEIDPALEHQPLATLLEAAKWKNKSTGIVVKCEFPHATPASTSSHTVSRSRYPIIASQMAYQNIDVVFGGGTSFITDDIADHFRESNVSYYANDIDAFRSHTEGAVWALWRERELPYFLDHNGTEVPFLDEMTERAIELLSKNEEGFFLLVEGSLVDWAAHSNDAAGIITEFAEFDKAVEVAINFAKRDGNTTVVIAPDHGTSGFTVGNYELRNYHRKNLNELFSTVAGIKKTTVGIERELKSTESEDFTKVFKELTGIDLTEEELNELIAHRREGEIPEDYMQVGYSKNLITAIGKILNNRMSFGFCTFGHTGEDVFLAAYHPDNHIPYGANTIIDVNRYMADALGLGDGERLPDLTKKRFVKHTELFEEMEWEIDKSDKTFPILKVNNNGHKVEFPAHKSVVLVDGQKRDLGSIIVYIDTNDTFYLPIWSTEILLKEGVN